MPDTASQRPDGLALSPIQITPWGIWRGLAALIVLFLFLSTLGRLLLLYSPDFVTRDAFARYFYVDAERTIPTLFQVLEHIGCSLCAVLVALVLHRAGRRGVYRWLFIAGLFVMTGMDEYLALHELLIEPLRKGLHVGGVFRFAWVIPGMGLVAVLAAATGKLVLTLPPAIRNLVFLSAGLFVGGAVGLEMLGGAYIDAGGSFDSIGYVPYPFVEEAMEMFGTSTFMYTMLRYVTEHFGKLEISLHY